MNIDSQGNLTLRSADSLEISCGRLGCGHIIIQGNRVVAVLQERELPGSRLSIDDNRSIRAC
jgi:hypothetical protein